MNKYLRCLFLVTLSIILIFVLLTGCSLFSSQSGELLIKNGSNEKISNVSIKYVGAKKEINIGELKPNDEYKHKIEDTNDDGIMLIYTDSSGDKHEETAISYVTKGIPGATVTVKKSTDGKWSVESKNR